MPCSKCKKLKILFYDELLCPYCKKYAMVDSVTAQEITKQRVKYRTDKWNEYIKQFDKQSIMICMFEQREILCRKFFEQYSAVSISNIFTQTLLLKRIATMNQSSENTRICTKEEGKKISELYEEVLKIETDKIYVESCFIKMLYLKKFNIEKLSAKSLFENFLLLYTEEYIGLMNSYNKYNLMTEKKMNEKLKHWEKQFVKICENPPEPHQFSKEERVSRWYDFICTVYFSSLRNRLFLEAFDLRPYNEIIKDPLDLFKFTNTFSMEKDRISICDTDKFLGQAKKFFRGTSTAKLRKILLFEEGNTGIFPFFVRIQEEGKDYVLTSHGLANIIHIFLYPVITKKLFDCETAKRGKEYEQTLKKEFEKAGFWFCLNFKDKKKPTLEIDGIAIKGNYCFIIESKARQLLSLIEESNRRAQVIRDLKGVVDGFKFSKKNNQMHPEKITSLLEKIEYVKENSHIFKIQDNTKMKFVGILSILNYTRLTEYKSVKIITYEELFKKLSDNKICELVD